MPELPEIETIVQDMRPLVLGRAITGLIIRPKAIDHILRTDPRVFGQGIVNQTVITVIRKGKYIILPLSNDNVIVFHLGMTGQLLLVESPNVLFDEQLSDDTYIDKHTHLLLELADPSDEEEALELHFNDVRLFGNIWLVEDVQDIDQLDVPGLRDLGPDALSITPKGFKDIMFSKRAVKSILLDQSKIAGVGNIYVDEACFEAGVHPRTRGNTLDSAKEMLLWFAVKSVLNKGIKYRGSSTSDYITPDGSKGTFQQHHRVYGKTGQDCKECSAPIERIKVAGRSTHFCPVCQPEGS